MVPAPTIHPVCRRAPRFAERLVTLAAGLIFVGAVASPVAAQAPAAVFDAAWGRASHVVVPQSRVWDIGRFGQAITIERVGASITLRESVAETTLDIVIRNPGTRPVEAALLLPVPGGAAVSRFDFEGQASESTARLLPRDEARRTYDDIVRRTQDPALLEFVGTDLVRSSVFPVPAGGTQRLRLTYEHVLGGDGDRVDYVLPRSESLSASTVWDVQVTIASAAPISMVYSPSHALDIQRLGPGRFDITRTGAGAMESGPFMLSFLRERAGVNASVFAWPDPDSAVDGGMFLMLAGPASGVAGDVPDVVRRREVTIVIDRSGSMAGPKMDQVRAAALQVIAALGDDESFNIIDYATTVGRFRPAPVLHTKENVESARTYLAGLRPIGGTNIHDALRVSLAQPATPGCLPIVLFLTDGLPTVGQTAETTIRQLAAESNPAERRIFAFGVGNDVNAPLLDRIAEDTRATATYVQPEQDVEVAVGRVFRQLAGPVLANVEMAVRDEAGADAIHRILDLAPVRLPDLFSGDQIVLLGRYHGTEPLDLVLGGLAAGGPRAWTIRFDPARADVRHSFVPRLWASRRIAYLVDAIRQAGAVGPSGLPLDDVIEADPRLAELADEILALSARYGVLSEYTAFLATEGTSLDDWEVLSAECNINLDERAVRSRAGQGAVSQSLNVYAGKNAVALNRRNEYWNADLEQVTVSGVQQMCDAAFFRRGGGWIDGSLVTREAPREPTRTVAFDTPEHRALVDALAAIGRAGTVALRGDILIRFGDEIILVRNPS